LDDTYATAAFQRFKGSKVYLICPVRDELEGKSMNMTIKNMQYR